MKRTDIRWNLVFEFNRMNLVQDERTEQEAEKDRKISLVWTAALLVLLLWPLRDEGTSRGFAVVDLCALALRAVLDWRALHGGSFLLTGKEVTAWNGLSRTVLGGIWAGSALYYLLGARSLLVDLAAIGFGIAGVTEEFVTRELDSGRLRRLKTSFQIPPRSVDMCMLRDVPQTAAAERFAEFVKQSLSEK